MPSVFGGPTTDLRPEPGQPGGPALPIQAPSACPSLARGADEPRPRTAVTEWSGDRREPGGRRSRRHPRSTRSAVIPMIRGRAERPTRRSFGVRGGGRRHRGSLFRQSLDARTVRDRPLGGDGPCQSQGNDACTVDAPVVQSRCQGGRRGSGDEGLGVPTVVGGPGDGTSRCAGVRNLSGSVIPVGTELARSPGLLGPCRNGSGSRASRPCGCEPDAEAGRSAQP
jgi:hypothetical protein